MATPFLIDHRSLDYRISAVIPYLDFVLQFDEVTRLELPENVQDFREGHKL